MLKSLKPMWAESVSDENPFPSSKQANYLPLCPHMEVGAKELSSLLYKGTNPVHEGSTLITKIPPRGPTSKNHHIGK